MKPPPRRWFRHTATTILMTSNQLKQFVTDSTVGSLGRPRKLDAKAASLAVERRDTGKSWEAIAREFRNSGIDVSRWAVRRAVRGASSCAQPDGPPKLSATGHLSSRVH